MNPPLEWPGFFLVIDGIDGCGKTTQTKRLVKYFSDQGFHTHYTAEPSKGKVGVILREYLQDASTPAAVDALLFAADRVDHCTAEIFPLLQKGDLVVSDRYRLSSYVYQAVQGESQNLTLDWIKSINSFSLTPDLTIILDLSPEIALARKISQNADQNQGLEKFERIDFQKKIRAKFIQITSALSQNIEIIEGEGDMNAIFQQIVQIVTTYLEKKNKAKQ